MKLHRRRVTDPPESTLAPLATVQRTPHEQDAVLPIWNTEVTYDVPYQSPLPPARTVPYATRFSLTGVSAIDGTARAVRAGDALTVTGRPVLLASR